MEILSKAFPLRKNKVTGLQNNGRKSVSRRGKGMSLTVVDTYPQRSQAGGCLFLLLV